MSPLRILLFGVLLPAFAAGIVLFIAWRRTPPLAGGKWSGAVAFTLGYVIAYFVAFGMPPFPPIDAMQWLVYLAVVAMVIGLTESFFQIPSWTRWLLRWVFSVLMLWLLLRTMVTYTWGVPKGVVWLLSLSLMMLLFWTALDNLSEKVTGSLVPVLFFTTALGSSVALMLGRSASVSQLCGSVTAILAVSAVVGWQHPNFTLAKGAMAVLITLIFGFWLNGVFFAYLPMVTAILLTLSPLTGWLGQVTFMRHLPSWQSVSLQLIVALLLVGIANIIAVWLLGMPTVF